MIRFISQRLLLAQRVRYCCCLSAIFDHFIHPGVCAQEAVSKRHGVRAWLGSRLRAFRKMIYADFAYLALWRTTEFRR
jgi:hypothetical protein